jgi:hypothetical protein
MNIINRKQSWRSSMLCYRMLSVMALASDNVLMLMVDMLVGLEVPCPLAPAVLDNCGAAVTDMLISDEVEPVNKVVRFDRDGVELAAIGDDDESVEFVMLDVVAAELINGKEEATGLATAWLFVLLESALVVTDDCIDMADAEAGVPLDDEFCKNAGSNAMENAFARQAQAQLQA